MISRPTTNFCRLPPDSARAATWGPGVRTSKVSITRSAKPRALRQLTKPRLTSFSRQAPVSRAFSVRLMSGAAAWPRRSSGALSKPSARRAVGPIWPMPSSIMRIAPGALRVSPDKAASSSSWPFPATPPMPKTSPSRTVRLMDLSAVPKADCGGRDRSRTCNRISPGLVCSRDGWCRDCPTISSASDRALSARGSARPTTLPSRSTVAFSHRVRISSSLCEI